MVNSAIADTSTVARRFATPALIAMSDGSSHARAHRLLADDVGCRESAQAERRGCAPAVTQPIAVHYWKLSRRYVISLAKVRAGNRGRTCLHIRIRPERA